MWDHAHEQTSTNTAALAGMAGQSILRIVILATSSDPSHRSTMEHPCIARPLDVVRTAFAAAEKGGTGDWGVRRRFEEALTDPVIFGQASKFERTGADHMHDTG